MTSYIESDKTSISGRKNHHGLDPRKYPHLVNAIKRQTMMHGPEDDDNKRFWDTAVLQSYQPPEPLGPDLGKRLMNGSALLSVVTLAANNFDPNDPYFDRAPELEAA